MGRARPPRATRDARGGDAGGAQQGNGHGNQSPQRKRISKKSKPTLRDLQEDNRILQDKIKELEILAGVRPPLPPATPNNSKPWRSGQMTVPDVIESLKNAAPPDLLLQYPALFQENASYQLRANEESVRVGVESAKKALVPRDDKYNILVIGGAAGAGKTRLGFEMLRLLTDSGGVDRTSLEQQSGVKFLAVPLYIDFNNGMAYDDDVDRVSMDHNVAVRLAARALDVSMGDLKTSMKRRSFNGITTAGVLDAIVTGALCHAGNPVGTGGPACPASVVVLVLHLDEYQYYMRALTDKGASDKVARRRFKTMLSAISTYAREGRRADGIRVTIVPVLSGTPRTGLELLSSDSLVEIALHPGALDQEAAAALVADVIASSTRLRHLRQQAVAVILDQVEARVALADTTYRPRHLVSLGVYVRTLLEVAENPSAALRFVDWNAAVTAVSAALPGVCGVSRYETLVRLVLSKAPVRRPLSSGEGVSKPERYVHEAMMDGLVEVQHVGGDYYRTLVPWVHLRTWGLANVLPAHLVNTAVFTWREAEIVLAHCISAVLHPGLRSLPLTLRSIFPGALGVKQLPDAVAVLQNERKVYHEVSQYISSSTSVPPLQPSVRAFGESESLKAASDVDLHEGVFLTRTGNCTVDVRSSVRVVTHGASWNDLHIVVQSKHTTVDDTVSESVITEWYKEVRTATAEWVSDKDRVLYVYFTNKQLSDPAKRALDADYFLSHPFLCVVSADQLGAIIPSCLITRILTSKVPCPK